MGLRARRNPLEAGQKFNLNDGKTIPSSGVVAVAIPLKRGKSSTSYIQVTEQIRSGRNPLEAGQKFNLNDGITIPPSGEVSQSP